VSLALSVAGVALGTPSGGTIDVQAGQPWSTTLTPPSWVRYVAGGAVHGRVEVTHDGRVAAAQDFTITPMRSPFVTAMGTGSILVVLCAFAYLEYLESVRRSIVAGHLRHAGTTVAAVVGLPLGVGIWMAAAVFTGREPVFGAGIVCAIAGAVLAAAGGPLCPSASPVPRTSRIFRTRVRCAALVRDVAATRRPMIRERGRTPASARVPARAMPLKIQLMCSR
jgi:hypothetical protein